MKKTSFFLIFFILLFLPLSAQCGIMENVTYVNLIDDLQDEVIVETTVSLREGVNETTVNVYKYTVDDRLKLIWKGIKRMGFLSVFDRRPPYENASQLPFCLVSDISVIDPDGDGVMEIEMTTKKIYYDKETRSRIVSEEPVHARVFRWDEEDQRYE